MTKQWMDQNTEIAFKKAGLDFHKIKLLINNLSSACKKKKILISETQINNLCNCDPLSYNAIKEKVQQFIEENKLKVSIKKLESKTKKQIKAEKQGDEIYKDYSLQETKKAITKWLAIDDDEIIDIIFSFAIGEKVPGDPSWLFLIAPPGGTKTETLRAIEGYEYYHLSDLTSKTFISGLMVKEGKTRRKVEDLLPQLDKKIILFKDFTTILEKNKEERREIISQLREIYDGMYSKKVGTMDKKIEYKARFGFIAGVTPIIDKHWKIMQQLGERFLKCRWQEDEEKTTLQAEKNEGQEKVMRDEIKEAVMGFLSNLEIKEVTFNKKNTRTLIDLAKFLAWIRTPIQIQSGQTDFYYDFIPTPERPTRLVKQLKKTAKCLALVRGRSKTNEADLNTIIRIAQDTAPQDRIETIRAIKKHQNTTMEGCTTRQIMEDVKLPATSIGRICEQLRLLDLIYVTNVTKEGYGTSEYVKYYKLTEKVPISLLEKPVLSPCTYVNATKKVQGDSTYMKIPKMTGKKHPESQEKDPNLENYFQEVTPTHTKCTICYGIEDDGLVWQSKETSKMLCLACAMQVTINKKNER